MRRRFTSASVNTEPQSLPPGHQIKQEMDPRQSRKRKEPPSPTDELISFIFSPEPYLSDYVDEQPTTSNHAGRAPGASRIERECPVHKKSLKYYCKQDKTYICTTCIIEGDHKEHDRDSLEKLAQEKKKSLQDKRQTLNQEGIKLSNNIENTGSKEVEEQTSFIKLELEDLKINVLKEISDYNKQLKDKKEVIDEKMNRITELCNEKDTLTFLKEEKELSEEIEVFSRRGGQYDKLCIPQIIRQEVLKLADGLIRQMLDEPPRNKSKIILDASTANKNLDIFNPTTVTYCKKNGVRKTDNNQFKSPHVLSKTKFGSGNHYWEVEVRGTQCSIGVAYKSLDRKTGTKKSRIGNNLQSWSLHLEDLSVSHNNVQRKIETDSPVRSFGVFLEYEAGRLSFYQLCDPIRRLHTFTATFTEPLHAAFYLKEGSRITVQQ